jgi:Pyridoxamine 5'-phosphate oxidase
MASWAEFEAAEPQLAALGRKLLDRNGAGEGLLTTVRGEQLPRTHPVNVGIVDGRLLTFVQAGSAKARDFEADGRYALHAHQDPAVPHEFLLRGRGSIVADPATRARAAASWPFTPDDSYPLVELSIEHALIGERPDADAWPPRYTSWRPR